jgi:hypothetical protein
VRRLAAWLRDTTVDGEEQAGGLADLAPTLTLEFDFDGNATLLELTKVSIPLYVRRRGERTMVDTHTFAVITTHLRSAVSTPPETDTQTETEPIPRIPITPLAGLGVGVGVHTRAEAEEDGQEELAEEQGPEGPEGPAPLPADPSPEPEVRSPSKFRTPFVPTPSRLVLPRQRPLVPYADAGRLVDTTTPPLRQYLFFARDGSVRRSPAPPREASGRSLVGVPVFGNVDWAKTPVGPEEQWDERLCLLRESKKRV